MTDVRWSHNPQNIRSPVLDGGGFSAPRPSRFTSGKTGYPS